MGRLEETLDLEGRRALASVLAGLGAGRDPLKVGRYEIGEVLGRGACGQVYAAHDPQLDREVAIKVVLSSAKRRDPEAESRLRREAEALARLQDPHVVPVYDVGIDELGVGAGGRPRRGVYVVMARIRGETLDVWRKKASPTPAAIVDAYVQAARGLHAAHAVDVVHRDFKPGNAMRTEDGTVVVLDFGLARALDEADSLSADRTGRPALISGSDSLTTTGTVVGTPRYMAPEQHGAEAATAAADQFAWCVALWEALDAKPPFRGQTIQALAEAKRSGELPPGRGIPKELREVLARGLRPDPSARWPSMAALCDALSSRGQRRRRRIAGYSVAALVIGTAGVWGAQQWAQARAQAACEAQAQTIEEVWSPSRADAIGDAFAATELSYAPETWKRSRPRLEAYVADWVQARRRTCDPASHMSAEVAAASRACLEDRRAHLAALLDDLAAPDARVVHAASLAVARVPPVSSCSEALALRRYMDLPSDPAAARRLGELRAQLATIVAGQSMGRHDVAMEALPEIIDEADALGQLALAARARLAAADSKDRRGEVGEASELAEAAYFAADGIDRTDIALQASTMLVFFVGVSQADHEGGMRWARTAKTLAERTDADPLLVAGMLLNVGTLHRRAGQTETAREHLERALGLYEDWYGPEHPRVSTALLNLSSVHYDLGHFEKAIALLERALTIDEAHLGPSHPSTASALNNLGVVQHRLGNHARARDYHRRALQIREEALGKSHPDVGVSVNNLGSALKELDDIEGAIAAYERAQQIAEHVHGPEHPMVANAVDNLALVYRQRGELDRALALHERALQMREAAFGPEHPTVARSLAGVGRVRVAKGEVDAAVRAYERARRIWAKAHGEVHPLVASAHEYLGDAYGADGEPAKAAASYERALQIHLHVETADVDLAQVRFGLAKALWDAGTDRGRARALTRQALETWRADGDEAWDELRAEAEAWLTAHEEGATDRQNAGSGRP